MSDEEQRDDDYYEAADDSEEKRRPRDRKIDEAKAVLMERFFPEDGKAVYYARQLEIAVERQFFHWITKKALNELVAQRAMSFKREQLEHHIAHFFFPRRHRYPRRQIRQTIDLIAEFSDPQFTRALGHHGEMLMDAGFARIGFRIRANKVRAVGDRPWTQTNHDLDPLIERDGLKYGVEIKNQLGYIEQTEFRTKLDMCRFFGVRPLFVARMMPKSYINDVQLAGGFALILNNQHYPLLADDLARRVRERLDLPVRVLTALPDTTLDRFEHWHKRHLGSS